MSTSSNRPLRIGLVGLGYWGPNLARNVARLDTVELAYGCDLDPQNQARFRTAYPAAHCTDRFEDLLDDDDLDAVIIATGSSTHAALGRRVLEAKKHLFVEKPLALSTADAYDLVRRAEEQNRVLMVGHLLRFHPAFAKMQEMVAAGELGRVLYLYANRQNFGKVRSDENALWSLGPHDISLILALAGERPLEVSARGGSYLQEGIEDVVFCYLRFGSGVIAHLHLSWLDPHKRRMLTVVGTEQMAVFDDTETDRKLTVYVKTSLPHRFETWDEFKALQSGDIHIPHLARTEPLAVEMQAFCTACRTGQADTANGSEGALVVEVLDALDRSLREGGRSISLDPATV